MNNIKNNIQNVKKILYVSLGCDKNTVDLEKIIGILFSNGFYITYNEYDADIIIINTCCFIKDAKEESINAIIDYGRLKYTGKLKYLIVTGCLAQRYADKIKTDLPEVDAIVGTSSYDKIIDVIKTLEQSKVPLVEIRDDINRMPVVNSHRIIITPGYYDYLKIAEGCNKNCTYCIIPKVRGGYRSIPMNELIEEARLLASQGCREIILVAQETTLYGIDLYGKKMLHKLIENLCKLTQIQWIRILYMYPEEITEELIDVIANEEKVCSYIDIPIQHCNNRILKAMGRRTNKVELIDKINFIRDKISNVTLRTTIITGFPTETDVEHKEMLDFIKNVKFDKLGCFTYSCEEGTIASTMCGQIDENIKFYRRDEIMQTQQKIVFEKLQNKIGKIFDVIIEGYSSDKNVYIGRTMFDAPNVDSYVYINYNNILYMGDIVKVKIIEFIGYDLIGKVLYNEFAK